MLLLDTCAAIWLVNQEPLSANALSAIRRASRSRELFLSPISAWEIGMLIANRGLQPSVSTETYIQTLFAFPGANLAPVSAEVALRSCFLPGNFHRDPADRMLVATAREMNLTLVTRDRKILDYARDGHLKALSC